MESKNKNQILKELSIIIVHYNTPDLLIRCLNSILDGEFDLSSSEIIVVDNNSETISRDLITKMFPIVIWVQKETNDGFGRANNIGVAKSTGQYILLLNSDIVVEKQTIEKSLEKIQSDKTIGALGCKLINEDGTLQKSVYQNVLSCKWLLVQNIIISYFIKFRAAQIDALMGSFLLIPRSVYDATGGFDPDFFMYSEEVDLCIRIKNTGLLLEFYDSVFAWHKHGASSSDKNWSGRQKMLSHALLVYKRKGLLSYIMYHFLFIFNTITNFIFMWFLHESPENKYRNSYFKEQSYYFCNIGQYIELPIKFRQKRGNGRKLLRAKSTNK